MEKKNSKTSQKFWVVVTIIQTLFLAVPLPAFADSTSDGTSAQIILAGPDPVNPGIAPIKFTYKFVNGYVGNAKISSAIIDAGGKAVKNWYAFMVLPDRNSVLEQQWNGKDDNNNAVQNSKYTFRIWGTANAYDAPINAAEQSFTLQNPDNPQENPLNPNLKITDISPNPYNSNNGEINFNYQLFLANNATVNARIYDSSGSAIKKWSFPNQESGPKSIKWDGKDENSKTVPNGNYTFAIGGYNNDDLALPISSAQKNFIVKKSALNFDLNPALSVLSINPDPFDPSSGGLTISYKLDFASNAAINAEVVENGGSSIKKWIFSNQSSGPKTLKWDGQNEKGTVGNGAYTLKLSGKEGDNDILADTFSFAIQNSLIVNAGSKLCAGFVDIKMSDHNCPAYTWVKNIGAMTGNPNGTFAPNGLLQRDQITKIVLETFQLFQKNNDYCQSTLPFPDISKNEWALQYICDGKILKMITGYLDGSEAGLFKPGRSVNRVEFLALVLRNLKNEIMPDAASTSYADVQTGLWFSGYSKYAMDKGLFAGTNLEPQKFMTRNEVAEVLYKLHTLGKI